MVAQDLQTGRLVAGGATNLQNIGTVNGGNGGNGGQGYNVRNPGNPGTAGTAPGATNTYNLRDIVVSENYGTTNAQQGAIVVFENSGA